MGWVLSNSCISSCSSSSGSSKSLSCVQVCHRIEEDDAMGWLPAQVKMMKGEFVVIDYVHAAHSVTDIVNVDLVRLPSKT